MKPSDFEIGQTVFVQDTQRRSEGGTLEPQRVAKIGRKWVTLEGWRGHRFDPDTMRLDGGDYGSPGRVWLTEADHADRAEAAAAWGVLYRHLGFIPPAGVITAQVREIAAILQIDLEPAMKAAAR